MVKLTLRRCFGSVGGVLVGEVNPESDDVTVSLPRLMC